MTIEPELRLSLDQLGEIGPMTVAFDRSLTIRYLGPAWANADPGASVGQPLGTRVRIVRPATPLNFEELVSRATSSTFLDVIATGLPLRGQFLRAGPDALIFFGKPWITRQSDLERYGVTLSDLSLSDRDFLFVLQTKDVSIDDAARLADRLAAQRAEQRRTLDTMAAQFAVTRVLADAQTLEQAASGIVESLCGVAGWSCGLVWRADRRSGRELLCVDGWTRPGVSSAFVETSRAMRITHGHDLPGRVWAMGGTMSIEDISAEHDCTRAVIAAETGIQRAFAIAIGGDANADANASDPSDGVVGVIELFGPADRPLEAQTLAVFESLRSQIGQFLQRRRSEEALRVSEERTRLIIDSALDAVVTIDARGMVHAWNTQAERTFGWTAAEAIGRELADLIVPASQRDAHRRGVARPMQDRNSAMLGRRLELTAVDRDGREFPVEVSISPVNRARGRDGDDRGGLPILYSGFIRDITARRESEEALRKAKEDAEAAAAAKSDFLATMSHEIRTPMNAVIELTGLLLETPLTDGQRAFAETVRGAGESLLTIINDILDFSKVEAGQLELENLVFSPADLVRDITELLGPTARDKAVDLVEQIASDVPAAVVADPGRVRQVLMNLVANAVKFTEHGEIAVMADVVKTDGDTVWVRFRVKDSGVGIAADALPRLFKPFSQADSSMSRRYGGTGLGLAICDRLTRLMGGTIDVESVVGSGSCFSITIPTTRAADEGRARVGSARPDLSAWVASEHEPVRVLVVEDNPANQIVAVAMLKRLGVRVGVASDGAEAVGAVHRVPYDLVLMDCQMPGMDGYTATRRIRDAEATGRRMPIIALTANVLAGEQERCLAAGMDDYLAKPIRIEELAGVLARFVPKSGAAPAVAPPAPRSAAPVDQLQLVRDAMGDGWNDARDIFVTHSRTLIQQMRAATAFRNHQELQRLAHSLRGGCEMMGARACGALARAMERAAADSGTLPSTATLNELSDAFDQIASSMEAIDVKGSES